MPNILRRGASIVKAEANYRLRRFALTELLFSVTAKCNFRCKHCFYAKTMDQNIRAGEKELDLEEIEKISRSIGPLEKLLITGGEPFLRNDLPEICDTFRFQNKISSIYIPSNGSCPEKVHDGTLLILKKCRVIGVTITLSLDGLRETHDHIRGFPGSFDLVLETAQLLNSLKVAFKNLKVVISTTVNDRNLSEIPKLAKFVKDQLPVSQHMINPLRGDPYDKNIHAPFQEEWSGLSGNLEAYRDYWTSRSLANGFRRFLDRNRKRYVDKIYSRIMKGHRMPFRCQAGNTMGVLESNGDVRFCELKKTVGNVRSYDYDFRKVWFSEDAHEFRRAIRTCACTHSCFLPHSLTLAPVELLRASFNI